MLILPVFRDEPNTGRINHVNEETGKSYIVYTDNSVDEDGNTQVFEPIYNPDSDEQRLMPIETEKEWKIIEIILEELQAGIKSDNE